MYGRYFLVIKIYKIYKIPGKKLMSLQVSIKCEKCCLAGFVFFTSNNMSDPNLTRR